MHGEVGCRWRYRSNVLDATLDPHLHIAAFQLKLGDIFFDQELDEFFQFFLVHGLRWDCFLLLSRQPERPGDVSDARAEN